MKSRLLWALTKSLWATAAAAFILTAYAHSMPRFLA